MSLYHSNERWQRSGITSQAEMLRRAPGFNRLYFDPKTGTLLQREGDVGSDQEDGGENECDKGKLMNEVQDEFLMMHAFNEDVLKGFSNREDYSKALKYAVERVSLGFDECYKWSLDYLNFVRASQNYSSAAHNEFPPDFVDLDKYLQSDCDFNNYDESKDNSSQSKNDSLDTWNRLMTLLWACHQCPDLSDNILSDYFLNGDKRNLLIPNVNMDNADQNLKAKSVTAVGRKLFILHVIVSCPLFTDDILSKALKVCPRRGRATSMHMYLNKYEPIKMSMIAVAAISSPNHFEAFGEEEDCVSRCIINRLLRCSLQSAQEAVYVDKRDNSKRLLPFHLAILSGKAWNNGTGSLYAAYATVSSIKAPKYNWFPLHFAAYGNNTHTSVRKQLLHLEPGKALISDVHNRLPLHLLHESNSMDEVLDIVSAYPEGLQMQDKNGNKPKISHNVYVKMNEVKDAMAENTSCFKSSANKSVVTECSTFDETENGSIGGEDLSSVTNFVYECSDDYDYTLVPATRDHDLYKNPIELELATF